MQVIAKENNFRCNLIQEDCEAQSHWDPSSEVISTGDEDRAWARETRVWGSWVDISVLVCLMATRTAAYLDNEWEWVDVKNYDNKSITTPGGAD